VGEVLDKVIRKLGLEKELAGQAALAEWDPVVGERIARVTRARDVSRGTLFVEVRSSPWLSELNLMRHDLIRRLNARLSGARIERIVFLLAERPDEDPPD
jgi:predicted nucleic acid-binding Zn ribbon protein